MTPTLRPLDALDFVRTISPDDWMARNTTPEGYFRRGYQALRLVAQEIERAGLAARLHDRNGAGAILDFGCGHGGVARMLRAHYPAARIVGQDVSRDWLDWCEAHLGLETIQSPDRISEVSLSPATFDVIWVGSVFTHVPEASFDHLLAQLLRALRQGGVVIFTTAGERVRRSFVPGKEQFLEASAAEAAVIGYDRDGYGFAPYIGGRYPDWGRSLTAFARVFPKLERQGARLLAFQDGGWSLRQDVYSAVPT